MALGSALRTLSLLRHLDLNCTLGVPPPVLHARRTVLVTRVPPCCGLNARQQHGLTQWRPLASALRCRAFNSLKCSTLPVRCTLTARAWTTSTDDALGACGDAENTKLGTEGAEGMARGIAACTSLTSVNVEGVLGVGHVAQLVVACVSPS